MKLQKGLVILVVLGLALGLSAHAYAQTAINPGDSVQGTLSNNTAQYSFTAKAGETVVISLNSDAFDPLLELYASNGNQVGRDDDSGGFPNARLVFTAPADGTYTITVTSFSGAATGAYTLSLETQTATAITYGTPVETKMAGTTPLYFTFNGTEGDVVDIYAVSVADEDTRLTVRGPDGNEIIGDDDSGAGTNPYIRRLILPDTGAYQLELAPFSDQALSGDITVTIEQTELLALDANPQTVSLGGDSPDAEVFRFDGTAGTIYRLVVEADAANTSGVNVSISRGTDFPTTSLNAYGTSRVTLDFAPESTGEVVVEVSSSTFSDTPTSVTVYLQPVE
jgi:hypothetical protein